MFEKPGTGAFSLYGPVHRQLQNSGGDSVVDARAVAGSEPDEIY